MSRMFDRLLEHGLNIAPAMRPVWNYPKEAGELRGMLAGLEEHLKKSPPVIVVADNVAEYFYMGTDQERWDLTEDFPSLAPPWDDCFIEFKMPPKVVSCEHGVTETHPWSGTHRAALVETKAMENIGDSFPAGIDLPHDAHWVQRVTTFFELGKGDISLVGFSFWFVRRDGSVIDPGEGKWLHMLLGN